MTFKIKTKTIGSGDITNNKFSVTIGELEKVEYAGISISATISGERVISERQVISGNIVDVYVQREVLTAGTSGTLTSGMYWQATGTSGNQISGAVATVIAYGY